MQIMIPFSGSQEVEIQTPRNDNGPIKQVPVYFSANVLQQELNVDEAPTFDVAVPENAADFNRNASLGE